MEEKKRYQQSKVVNKKVHIILISICIVLGGVALWQYVERQQFTIKEVDLRNLQSLVEEKEIIKGEQHFFLEISDYEFTQLLGNSLKDEKIEEYTIENVLWKDQRIYLQIKKDQKIHSYVAKAKFEIQDEQLMMHLSGIKMGTLHSNVAGKIMWTIDKLPKTIELPVYMKNEFMYVTAVEISDGNRVKLTLDYNLENFSERMQNYNEGIDLAKLELQKNQANVQDVVKLLQQERYSIEDQQHFITYVNEGEEAISNLALIFNEATTRVFLQDFRDLYAKRINVERIVQKSKSELEQNVDAYHLQFASSVLKYLYDYPSFTTVDGKVIVNGQDITAATIIANENIAEKYKTSLSVKDKKLVATYEIGNQTMSKTIIRKGWVE